MATGERATPATVEAVRLEIKNRMRAGQAFTDVEDWLNSHDFPEEILSALWLYALSYVPPHTQRTDALEHLIAVTG